MNTEISQQNIEIERMSPNQLVCSWVEKSNYPNANLPRLLYNLIKFQ